MSSLYQKHRPQTFSQVSGQKFTIQTLANSIKHDRIGHAYLFTGPRGTGKTTLARVFAKAINCLDPQTGSKEIAVEPCNKCENCQLIKNDKALDLVEIDAASHTGVDNIRALKETVALPPTQLKYKVYIIDEVHMLSMGAFNALLKTLEEPPAHVVFILATTEHHKVPETIISRCQQFNIAPLTQQQIIDRLQQISEKEKVKIELEALETIAISADGGMRDAESMLTQIMSLENENITAEKVNQILGTSSKQNVVKFVQLIFQENLPEALHKIEFLQTNGINLKNFNKALLSYLRNLMLIKASPENHRTLVANLTQDQIEQAQDLIQTVDLKKILQLIDLFQKSLEQFRIVTLPSLPLELATIEFLSNTEETNSNEEVPPNSGAPEPPSKIESKKTEPITPALKKAEAEPPTTEQSAPAEEASATKDGSTETEVKKEQSPEETDENPVTKTSIGTKSDNKSIQLSELLDQWSNILEETKPLNHSVHAFLKNCIPLGINDQKLYIKAKYDFYKDKLDEPGNKLTVQQVIAKITNADLKIVFVNEQEAKKLNFAAEEKPDKNPLHTAMKLMGGRIINS